MPRFETNLVASCGVWPRVKFAKCFNKENIMYISLYTCSFACMQYKGCKSKNVNRSLLHPPRVHPKKVVDVGGRQITKIDYD